MFALYDPTKRKTTDRARQHLEELEQYTVSYGCPEGSPGPCKRLYIKNSIGEKEREDAVDSALFAENGRKCKKGFQRSHRCREATRTKRSKCGTCIVGKHIVEQKTGAANERNFHQHLLQEYLKSIRSKGWEKKVYYVSDVPEEFVRKYLKKQKAQHIGAKKVECKCAGGQCFINVYLTSQYKKQ